MAVIYNNGHRWDNKRICDLIFAGSHDAGILYGNRLARTQRLDIRSQAVCGARFFDVRIAFHNPSTGKAQHKSFHAADKIKHESTGGALEYGKKGKTITTLAPQMGTWGLSLKKILTDAKDFVTNRARTEFIILKFSKSDNMYDVGLFIDGHLGDAQFDSLGEVNEKTLQEVAGKVICVYEDTAGMSEIRTTGMMRGTTPRYQCVNLFKGGGGYMDAFNGLQWYGKGGVSADESGDDDKIQENIRVQGSLMGGAKNMGNDKVLGVIYATATGGARSIKKRDKKIWLGTAKEDLMNIMKDHADGRIDTDVIWAGPAVQHAAYRKFYPNVVMMDFVDEARCSDVYNLNIDFEGPMGTRVDFAGRTRN